MFLASTLLLSTAVAQEPSLPGSFDWVSGQILEILSNQRVNVYQNGNKINQGRWESIGPRRYRLVHESGGYVDTIELSTDGRIITGTNNFGGSLRGVRRGTSSSTGAPGGAWLPGSFDWVEGQFLVVHPNQRFTVYLNGSKINEGRWESIGPRRFRLTHEKGGYVDTFDLSDDDKYLGRVNNLGSKLNGVRRVSSPRP